MKNEGMLQQLQYTIEVRHANGGVQPYSLEVYVLPTSPCP